jgi:SAM-dependent methyltransferase
MAVAEKVLLKFCREPAPEASSRPSEGSVAEAREEILRSFGEETVREFIVGKRVLDFGCGLGHHMAAMLELGAASVWGVDIQPWCVERARAMLADDPRARVVDGLAEPDWHQGVEFDAIFSLNSMEHIVEAEAWMRRWAGWLAPEGRLLVAFGPLWWSPYGAHVGYMTPLPWVHVLFSERTIMSVRRRYRSDGAARFEDVSGGLSRMTIKKFHRCIRGAGLEVDRIQYGAVRSLPLVTKVPVVREFFTQGLSAILKRAPG